MCQIDVCTCTRLFETMPGVQPPSPILSPANHPLSCRCPSCALPYEAATVPYQPLPLPIRSIRRPPTSPISCSSFSSPVALHLTSVVASTIRNAHHLLSPSIRTTSYSPFSLRLFPFLFPLPSSSNARSNPPGGYSVPYGTVSTGTPARSLKENAIIRRTSTNELIVGASLYRQYWEVLYSTSPGATRL